MTVDPKVMKSFMDVIGPFESFHTFKVPTPTKEVEDYLAFFDFESLISDDEIALIVVSIRKEEIDGSELS